jgi:endo-1,4-beta-xylanase
MNDLIGSSLGKEEVIEIMKRYITDVMTHYKGKIYSWDILNEAFPDGVNANGDWKTSMRTGAANTGNPWFVKIGSDFVYEAFLAARLADPAAILYYNDFNTDQTGKATMIRNMVRDVNDRYLASRDKPAGEDPGRLLIDGIGIQEHHNVNVSAASVKASLDLFRPLGVIIAVSELDVLSQPYNDFDPGRVVPTNNGKLTAANLYGQYFGLYLENSDIIERVSLWGIVDGLSWRRSALPLLFEAEGATGFNVPPPYFAKPAYYKMIEALEARQ